MAMPPAIPVARGRFVGSARDPMTRDAAAQVCPRIGAVPLAYVAMSMSTVAMFVGGPLDGESRPVANDATEYVCRAAVPIDPSRPLDPNAPLLRFRHRYLASGGGKFVHAGFQPDPT
jgi:hypothetical protein